VPLGVRSPLALAFLRRGFNPERREVGRGGEVIGGATHLGEHGEWGER